MKRATTALLTLFFLGQAVHAIVAPVPEDAREVDLKLDLAPHWRTRQTVELEWSTARGEERFVHRIGVNRRLRTLERASEAGGTWIAVTHERLWHKTLEGTTRFPDYDSAESSEDPPVHLPWEGTALAAVLNQTLHVEYDRRGRPVRIEAWEPAFDAMIESFSKEEEIPDEDIERRAAGFEAYLLRNVFPAWVALPESAVSPGDTWTHERPSEQGVVRSNFTLRTLQDKLTLLDIGGSVRTRLAGDAPQTGKAAIDPSTGWLVSASVLQSIANQGRSHSVHLSTTQPWAPVD